MKKQGYIKIMYDNIFIPFMTIILLSVLYSNEVERKRKKNRGGIKYPRGHTSPALKSKINQLR